MQSAGMCKGWHLLRTRIQSSPSIWIARRLLARWSPTSSSSSSSTAACYSTQSQVLSARAAALATHTLWSKERDSFEPVSRLTLSQLQDMPGASHQKRRVGRGVGSGRGKTCGKGHKGQKSRSGGSIPPQFEGGQTPLYKRIPKRGFINKHATPMTPINLDKIYNYIVMGRLAADRPITIRSLLDAGMFSASAVKHGVKLLADGKESIIAATSPTSGVAAVATPSSSSSLSTMVTLPPLHITVNRASQAAVDAIERTGGTVTTVHYNTLALRAVLRPHLLQTKQEKKALKRERVTSRLRHYEETMALECVDQDDDMQQVGQQGNSRIKFARPPPKWQPYYTRWANRGYLHPAVQMRQWLDKQPAQVQEQFDQVWTRRQQQQDD